MLRINNIKMQNLKLISWNVNGINSVQKRKHIFYWLCKQKGNAIALQQIHIKKHNSKYLGEEFSLLDKKEGYGFVY